MHPRDNHAEPRGLPPRDYCVGAVGEEFDFTFIERLLIASKALLFYP